MALTKLQAGKVQNLSWDIFNTEHAQNLEVLFRSTNATYAVSIKVGALYLEVTTQDITNMVQTTTKSAKIQPDRKWFGGLSQMSF